MRAPPIPRPSARYVPVLLLCPYGFAVLFAVVRRVLTGRGADSIMLVSPTNQVLLLHRVERSSSFPSAHVFPGGNLSEFHEGGGAKTAIPPPDSPERHADGPAYRLAAIRETFEESGILLARRRGDDRALLPLHVLSPAERDEGRRLVHDDQVRFEDWLSQMGAVPDVGLSLLSSPGTPFCSRSPGPSR